MDVFVASARWGPRTLLSQIKSHLLRISWEKITLSFSFLSDGFWSWKQKAWTSVRVNMNSLGRFNLSLKVIKSIARKIKHDRRFKVLESFSF